jgi:hypothetical protein
LKTLVEHLAAEYKLGISRWFGEVDVRGVYAVDPAHKLDSLIVQLRQLRSTNANLLVFHIGMQTDEMNALVDLNSFGLVGMSKHREAELAIITSEAFRTTVRDRQFELLTYRQFIKRLGLSSMKRPGESTN